MLLMPLAALLSSDCTIVATYVCRADKFIFEVLNLKISTKTVSVLFGMRGIKMSSRLDGICVINMVAMGPNLSTSPLDRMPPAAPNILQTIRMVPMVDYWMDQYLENQ